jgi:hypothetical protein
MTISKVTFIRDKYVSLISGSVTHRGCYYRQLR